MNSVTFLKVLLVGIVLAIAFPFAVDLLTAGLNRWEIFLGLH